MKKLGFIASLAIILLASSCNSQVTKTTESNNLTNVVKVLNRVQCHEDDRRICSQSYIDGIWEICMRHGFAVQMPQSTVKTSRDINELVQGSIEKQEVRTSKIQSIDGNGIVTEIDGNPTQVTVSLKYKGYCIGSEYIMQR